MFVQIHMLQSMPPGNLNRDESGQPKKCVFGGVTRGRISSQCLKRNIRRSQQFIDAFGDALADRTTYLPRMVADELQKNAMGVPDDELECLKAAIAEEFRKKKGKGDADEADEDEEGQDGGSEPGAASEADKTGQLVFFPPPFARRIAELLAAFRKEKPDAYQLFVTGEVNETAEQEAQRKAKSKELKDRKKAISADKKAPMTDDERASIKAKEEALKKDEQQFKTECQNTAEVLKKEIALLVADIAKASKTLTVDIGLFGRMTTSNLVVNVEAACQVAHAISTHETLIESDYFTAMDERKAQYTSSQTDQGGAAFMGTGDTVTFFNSAVYYKYLNLDLRALKNHLPDLSDNDAAQVAAVLVSAAALANPTGKQNSFASHGVPELILIELSKVKRPLSYANAFLQSVESGVGCNLMAESAKALCAYIDSVAPAFAPSDVRRLLLAAGAATSTQLATAHESTPSLDKLVEGVAREAAK